MAASADSLARLIVTLEAQTAQYQKGMEDAQKQLAKFQSQQMSSLASIEGGFKRFGKGISELLAGGGILIGFRAIATQLDRVSQEFQNTDEAARDFIRLEDELKTSTDELWRSLLRLAAPLIKDIADQMDPAEIAARTLASANNELTVSLDNLKAAQEALNNPNAIGGKGSLLNLFGDKQSRFDAAQEAVYAAKAKQVAAQATVDANKITFTPPGAARPDPVALVAESLRKANAEIENMFAGEQRVSQEMAKQQQAQDDLIRAKQHGFQMEEDFEAAMHEERLKAAGETLDVIIDSENNARKERQKARDDELKKQQEEAEKFGDLFANVLVQSNKAGLKQILADFLETLVIMAARAQAMKFFSEAQSSGGFLGGALSAIFGGPRAMGGPVAAGVPYMVGERGPEMFIPNTSGSISANRSGVTIHQNVTVGAGTSRAEVMAAMTIAKNAAKAEINNDRRRGR